MLILAGYANADYKARTAGFESFRLFSLWLGSNTGSSRYRYGNLRLFFQTIGV